jgi:hypothetical protein
VKPRELQRRLGGLWLFAAWKKAESADLERMRLELWIRLGRMRERYTSRQRHLIIPLVSTRSRSAFNTDEGEETRE